MPAQRGFTLIELVIVIVILGILTAAAVPKFVSLSDEAEQAAVEGIAGALGSAMATNFAACAALKHQPTAGTCQTISLASRSTVLTDEAGKVLQGGWPAGYTLTCTGSPGTNGESTPCTVAKTGITLPPEARNSFTLIAAGIVNTGDGGGGGGNNGGGNNGGGNNGGGGGGNCPPPTPGLPSPPHCL